VLATRSTLAELQTRIESRAATVVREKEAVVLKVHAVRAVAFAASAAALVCVVTFSAVSAGAATTSQKGAITPKVGGASSAFTITFKTPVSTGVIGKSIVYETVQANNAKVLSLRNASCLSSFQVDASYGSAGAPVSATARPSTHWCAGKWGVDVQVLKAPVCLEQGTCPNTVRHEIGYIEISAKFKVT
jgi:hypothetical protein